MRALYACSEDGRRQPDTRKGHAWNLSSPPPRDRGIAGLNLNHNLSNIVPPTTTRMTTAGIDLRGTSLRVRASQRLESLISPPRRTKVIHRIEPS